MALQLDVDIEAAADSHQALEIAPRHHVTAGRCLRPTAPGEADEPRRVLGEIVEGGRALALGRAHLDAGQEPAEVPVPLAVLDQEREPTAAVERHLGDGSVIPRRVQAP
jgi:hypothetical protein